MNCNGLCTLEQQNYGIKINLGKDEPKLGPYQTKNRSEIEKRKTGGNHNYFIHV